MENSSPCYKITTCPRREEYQGDTLELLTHHLESVREMPYFQVWVQHGDQGALGVFCNEQFASVGWVKEDGDYADAFNPNYCGAKDAVQAFYIENGQLDEYSECNCLPKQHGARAVLEFFQTGQRPSWLHWRES